MHKLDKFYYLCTMNTRERISYAIKNMPVGVVFDYADLSLRGNCSLAAAKAISRMVKSGELQKVGKGKFYKPKFSRLGEVPPMIDGLIGDLLWKNGTRIGYITGVQAFSQMGLTTQISSKILIAGNSYRRPLKRGGYDIAYTLQRNEITEDNIPLLLILDALKFIKEIPAATPDTVISQIRKLVQRMSAKELTIIEALSMRYSASVRALLGSILAFECGMKNELKSTLNDFTKYNIGVSPQVLPNKADWNIR
jgi:hypothetical protein